MQKTPARVCPAGLRNAGSTCYMNVVVQVLMRVHPFRQALYDAIPARDATGMLTKRGKVVEELQYAFARLHHGINPCVSLSDVSVESIFVAHTHYCIVGELD